MRKDPDPRLPSGNKVKSKVSLLSLNGFTIIYHHSHVWRTESCAKQLHCLSYIDREFVSKSLKFVKIRDCLTCFKIRKNSLSGAIFIWATDNIG